MIRRNEEHRELQNTIYKILKLKHNIPDKEKESDSEKVGIKNELQFQGLINSTYGEKVDRKMFNGLLNQFYTIEKLAEMAYKLIINSSKFPYRVNKFEIDHQRLWNIPFFPETKECFYIFLANELYIFQKKPEENYKQLKDLEIDLSKVQNNIKNADQVLKRIIEQKQDWEKFTSQTINFSLEDIYIKKDFPHVSWGNAIEREEKRLPLSELLIYLISGQKMWGGAIAFPIIVAKEKKEKSFSEEVLHCVYEELINSEIYFANPQFFMKQTPNIDVKNMWSPEKFPNYLLRYLIGIPEKNLDKFDVDLPRNKSDQMILHLQNEWSKLH